jgi:hypothetical protein
VILMVSSANPSRKSLSERPTMNRRNFLAAGPATACALTISNTSEADSASHDVGLAAPTAPIGASGSPINCPEGYAHLGSSGRIDLSYIIDNAEAFRLVRADDGWYWGIPIKSMKPF